MNAVASNPIQTRAPAARNVIESFRRQVEKFGNKAAVIADDDSVSYEELAARAESIGQYLAQRTKREQTVGVLTTRSVDMVAAILGIWEAGCAYVPLVPTDPPQRNKRILDVAECEIVLAHPELAGPEGPFHSPNARGIAPEIADVREISKARSPSATAMMEPSGADLAYVIFTSGSSGIPKGVEVEHHSLSSFLYACRDLIEYTEADCLLATTTIGFDVSLAEIFIPLISGGTVLLRSHDILASPERLAADITQFGVTVFQAMPAIWSLIIEENIDFPKLRVVINMGEAISNELASKLVRYGDAVWNFYGPTEATVYATACRLSETTLGGKGKSHESAPIGRPLSNTTIAILGADRRPVPKGERGELYIGGLGVARGYRNAQSLTDKLFVELGSDLGRMYRSGDLVALSEDGTIRFFGRNDDQLKIRGMRIEPGEIRASLIEHPSIADAAVTWFAKWSGARAIVAAIVVEHEDSIDEDELRDWLSLCLRPPMIPECFRFVRNLPRLPNKKIDYGKIREDAIAPQPESENTYLDREPTETEGALIRIWERILDVSPIGINAHFLAAGGDSLAAMQMIASVKQELGVPLAFGDVFKNLQLDHLAARIDGESELRNQSSFVFPLHEQGMEQPLFFSDADIRLAAEGRWTIDCPLFGISHWAQQDEFLSAKSIADLARTHVVAIRQIQPYGPYRLAGQQFGGIVALETAHQLQAQGQDVEMLFLLDPREPGKCETEEQSNINTTTPGIIGWLFDWLRYNPLSNWATYQVHHMGRARITNPAAAETLPRNQWPAFWGKERRITRSYVAKPYGGPVLAFFKERDGAYGAWETVFGSDENFHTLPAGQSDLFSDSSRTAWMSALFSSLNR